MKRRWHQFCIMNILTFKLRCHVADMRAILKLSSDTFMRNEANINAYFNIIALPSLPSPRRQHVDFAIFSLHNMHRMYSSAFHFMMHEELNLHQPERLQMNMFNAPLSFPIFSTGLRTTEKKASNGRKKSKAKLNLQIENLSISCLLT